MKFCAMTGKNCHSGRILVSSPGDVKRSSRVQLRASFPRPGSGECWPAAMELFVVCWLRWRSSKLCWLLGPGWRREVDAKSFCAARRTDLDAKILLVRETELEGRHLPFRDAVSELLETEWTRFPISGSRMARWVCKLVRDQDMAPRSRHVRWKASDQAVMDHDFCAQVLQSAWFFDQLNASELACSELSACRHRERILSGASNDELQEDLHLHMGTGETQHMLRIAMALVRPHDRGTPWRNVLKERRKMREERGITRWWQRSRVELSPNHDRQGGKRDQEAQVRSEHRQGFWAPGREELFLTLCAFQQWGPSGKRCQSRGKTGRSLAAR